MANLLCHVTLQKQGYYLSRAKQKLSREPLLPFNLSMGCSGVAWYLFWLTGYSSGIYGLVFLYVGTFYLFYVVRNFWKEPGDPICILEPDDLVLASGHPGLDGEFRYRGTRRLGRHYLQTFGVLSGHGGSVE